MSNNVLQLKIITPERELFTGDVKQVTLPTSEGIITVLPHHMPVVALLKAGEILFENENKEVTPIVISGGFIKIGENSLTILADTAERIEEIDKERAIEAQKRAQKMLHEKTQDAKEYALLVARMDKHLVRIKAVDRYR